MVTYKLRLLGGFALEGSGGEVAVNLSHRRAEALLAVLALEGALGCTRDHLAALLWPERDEQRARHSLRDALYAARSALGRATVVSAGDVLRLDSAYVASDVQQFEDALAAHRVSDAVAAYAGPLLDGFHLSDAPEFERWVDGERARLSRAYLDATIQLADAAEHEGDWRRAAEWWAHAVTLDPYDSRTVLRRIRALARGGDRANALMEGDAHLELLGSELEMEADPSFLEQLRRIREGELGPAELEVPDARRVDLMSEPTTQTDEVPADRSGSLAAATPTPGATANAANPVPVRALARDPRFIAVALVAIVALAFWIGGLAWATGGSGSQPVVRVPTPLGAGLGGGNSARLAISPAGDRIAWLQNDSAGGYRLLMRPTASIRATMAVPGGENADAPTFSPGGEWLAFTASSGDLVKVRVSGGQPVTVARDARLGGLHWSESGVIVGSGDEGIYQVPEVGGEPELILADRHARWPELLPGGEVLIYTERFGGPTGFDIRVKDLKHGGVRTVVPDATLARYLPVGVVIFARRGGTLFAAPFDLGTLRLTKEPLPVLEGVRLDERGATTQFAVARNGTAIYVRSADSDERELAVVSPDGSEEVLPIPDGWLASPRWAPDGVRIAYQSGGRIHVFSTLTGTNVEVSGDYASDFPVWSADASTITFCGRGPGTDDFDAVRVPADGRQLPRPLYSRPGVSGASALLPDDRLLVDEVNISEDIVVYELRGDSVVETPYLTADWNEWSPSVSPDGRWVAYASDETGQAEIYVRPFPEPAAEIRISLNGGVQARWSPDGRVLYYREDSTLVAAHLRREPTLVEVTRREQVYSWGDRYVPLRWAYDVHPSGKRFVVARLRKSHEQAPDEMVVVVNWFRELEERMR